MKKKVKVKIMKYSICIRYKRISYENIQMLINFYNAKDIIELRSFKITKTQYYELFLCPALTTYLNRYVSYYNDYLHIVEVYKVVFGFYMFPFICRICSLSSHCVCSLFTSSNGSGNVHNHHAL